MDITSLHRNTMAAASELLNTKQWLHRKHSDLSQEEKCKRNFKNSGSFKAVTQSQLVSSHDLLWRFIPSSLGQMCH